jgi:heme exporter protein B
MNLWQQTTALIKREFLQEQRQKYALFGVLLYIVSTIFIGRFSFRVINDIPVWNALFWTILLFSSVIGVARSFNQETRGRLLYLYFMTDPRALLLAKTIYNIALMLVLGLAGYFFYAFLIGNPVQNIGLFLAVLALGCLGLAVAFTMIAAIASRAGNNFTLMSILGFPVIIPLLMLTIKLSKIAADGVYAPNTWTYFGILALMNVLVFALAWILFPYLWRD